MNVDHRAIRTIAEQIRRTAVAYWRMVDEDGRYCLPRSEALSVLLVVVAPN